MKIHALPHAVMVNAIASLGVLSCLPAHAQVAGAIERALARRTMQQTQAKFLPKAAERKLLAKQAEQAMTKTSTGDNLVNRWTSSLCKLGVPCPLPAKMANAFVGGSYNEVELTQDTVMYRTYSVQKNKFGEPAVSWWTRDPKRGTQAVVENAIPFSTNANNADKLVKLRVPKGETIYEGESAQFRGANGSQNGPVGGGNQILLRRVEPSWEVK